jgi:hypothetical protein
VQTEQELQKRMNEREKTHFKSKANNGEDEWRSSTIEDTNATNIRLTNFELGP